jgi:hypothetical protein
LHPASTSCVRLARACKRRGATARYLPCLARIIT